MPTSPPPAQRATVGAQLDHKPVGDIEGRFFVARYQRGYRWGEAEVRRLLDDIERSEGKPYSLQPIVVKRRPEGDWELVDGQQRLTTLYLVFLFMQRERLQNAEPRYSIAYETRRASEEYLLNPNKEDSGKNIDFFHIHGAYECIRKWFEEKGHKRQHIANKVYGYLIESVLVIWYEAPPELDSTTLFTRLNVGRIPLTDAELIKALLLSRSRVAATAGRTDRTHEIAAQWDSIERDLRDDDVWAFVSDARPEDCPTRITLLLDTIAGEPPGGGRRPRFHTFETLRGEIETAPDTFWNRVVDLHSLVLGWFENRDHYHKIGYLVAVEHRFADLVALARDRAKSNFERQLDALIRDSLDLSPPGVMRLTYEGENHKEKCQRLLLLMNVETVRRMKGSSERYSFRLSRAEKWSLEHIHAQNAESLTKVEQWHEWLRLHREALGVLPGLDSGRRDELVARIDGAVRPLDRRRFFELARDVNAAFTQEDPSGAPSVHSVHSISNLAL